MIGFFETAANSVLGLSRPLKRAIAVGSDVVFCVLTVWFAFYLRLDHWVAPELEELVAVAISIALAIPIFVVSGLYRAIFRYSGGTALARIAQAGIVYGAGYSFIITFIQIDNIPRTVGLIQPVLLFLFVATSRVLVSWWLGDAYARIQSGGAKHTVMIYGAGSAGRQLFQALAASEMRVLGFIDDDPGLQGHLVLGRPVCAPSEIERLVEDYNLTDILLALPSASRRRRNQIIEMIRPYPVAVRTIPGLSDVAHGRVKTTDIRELDIGDLLGRETVSPDEDAMRQDVQGKIVMVTGAGGSIGSELCRQIVRLRPAILLLVELSEFALYTIQQELEQRIAIEGAEIRLVPLLGSVLDRDRLRQAMEVWKPQTIYHAAAYKHVPLVEHNPIVGIRNNVLGTMVAADLALEFHVDKFVLISTDKAVRPTNAMGASKRLAEMYLQALAEKSVHTHFGMVRFGNVLGSSGSVVPLFREQIDAGGPVTITHPEITRYFMTIPEAAELVIQAGAMTRGGDVFVLDMGKPVKIIDLAQRMIELSGLSVRGPDNPDGDIEIQVIGLRPGEKLYEELLIGNSPEKTSHPRIMKAMEKYIPLADLQSSLSAMSSAMDRGDVRKVRQILCYLVPDYTPSSDIVDWVFMEQQAA